MAEIVIDSYRCSGCGTCVELCPEVFRMDELTDKAELTMAVPAQIEAVYQAAAFCPEQCIVVT